MAHGTPDYGVTAGADGTHPLFDVGELAVRLGSIVGFDRRGDVLYIDGFELDTKRIDFFLDGTGAAAARSQTHAHHGEWSYKLTGGSDADRLTNLGFSEPAMVPGNVGVELFFNRPADIDNWYLGMDHYDGTQRHLFALTWWAATRTLTYFGPGQTEVLLASDIDMMAGLSPWHLFKLVTDVRTHRYVRAIVNNVTYDLAGFEPDIEPDVSQPRVECGPTLVSRAGFNDVAYVDCLIVTENEPA